MKLSLFADKLGICASLVCLIHCLIVPFLLIIGFDTILHLIDQEWIETGLILSSLLIGGYAFIRGFLSHRQHFVPVLFLAGFLLLVNGEAVTNTWLAPILSVTGALIIIYAHFQNLKLKQLHVFDH
ncbi:MAG: MerC domain-containing protein [Ekhidna sp.]|nr:MerC domain-containing protein [Ekhidna sp.]